MRYRARWLTLLKPSNPSEEVARVAQERTGVRDSPEVTVSDRTCNVRQTALWRYGKALFADDCLYGERFSALQRPRW